jgi:hypothetical protein
MKVKVISIIIFVVCLGIFSAKDALGPPDISLRRIKVSPSPESYILTPEEFLISYR